MPSSSSSSSSFGEDIPHPRASTRRVKLKCCGFHTISRYPYSLPDPSNELEVRYAALDAAKITARPLVAADDLIVRIFDAPRHRLQVSTLSTRGTREHTNIAYAHFKSSFRSVFRKTVDLEWTAEKFTKRMQDQGLVEKDEESALAFSNLCLRYAQLIYYTSRVTVSEVILNNKIQSRIIATSHIHKGTLMLELGGLMSDDALTPGSLGKDSNKRKRDQPQYALSSLIWKGSDRLLLGPARFVNHSCNPNSKLKPFPRTNAWGIESSKDIRAGEEITIYYGKRYFLPGECACASCQVAPTATDEPKPEPLGLDTSYPTPPAELVDSAKPRKRARTKS